jgi:hypothetical protein
VFLYMSSTYYLVTVQLSTVQAGVDSWWNVYVISELY